METGKCGTLVAEEQAYIALQENQILVRSERNYLITVSLDGMYTSYLTSYLTPYGGKFSSVMVPLLGRGQDRILLRWNHGADLDLWIDAVFGTGIQKFVSYDYSGYGSSLIINAATSITLDVDNPSGIAPEGGPETVGFNDIGKGTFKVWVNFYSEDAFGIFTPAMVDEAPAAVDVYSSRCVDENGVERAGQIATKVQSKEDVPSDGASWWNVGQLIAPSLSGLERLQWQSCLTECYSNMAPYGVERRSLPRPPKSSPLSLLAKKKDKHNPFPTIRSLSSSLNKSSVVPNDGAPRTSNQSKKNYFKNGSLSYPLDPLKVLSPSNQLHTHKKDRRPLAGPIRQTLFSSSDHFRRNNLLPVVRPPSKSEEDKFKLKSSRKSQHSSADNSLSVAATTRGLSRRHAKQFSLPHIFQQDIKMKVSPSLRNLANIQRPNPMDALLQAQRKKSRDGFAIGQNSSLLNLKRQRRNPLMKRGQRRLLHFIESPDGPYLDYTHANWTDPLNVGPFGSVVCVACPAGKYKDHSGSALCTDCSAGKYSTTIGLDSNSCISCPEFTSSQIASTALLDCSCNAGYTGPNGYSCDACEMGKYKSIVGSDRCISCESGKYGDTYASTSLEACSECPANSATYSPGSNSLFDCACNEGFTFDDTDDGWCIPCAPGTYKDFSGFQVCSPCLAGKYSETVGADTFTTCISCGENAFSSLQSTAPTDCSCNTGYIVADSGQCIACPNDNWCSAGDQNPCPFGSSSPQGSGVISDCRCNYGWYGSISFESDTCSSICGDGVRVNLEACDDGNKVTGDGCSYACTIEPGWTCTMNEASGLDICYTTCGDSTRVGSEECDDGNFDTGDGCSIDCTIECGYDCSTSPCVSTCGDGVRSANEGCDDGNVFSGDGCSSTCILETDSFACLALLCQQTICQEITSIDFVSSVENLECVQPSLGTVVPTWTHPHLVLVTNFEVECEHSAYEKSEVDLSFSVYDVLSGSPLSGATLMIFTDYPTSFRGCYELLQTDSSSCGMQLFSGTADYVTVSAHSDYLIVVHLLGYYTFYFATYIREYGESFSFALIQELETNQDRVVLSWGHTEDLDLWVYDKDDRAHHVGWNMEPRSDHFAGGTIILDVDSWSGEDGPETTQFLTLTQGTVEVWVNHYDNRFTASQVSEAPATVDIYCYRCLDDHDSVRVGLVTSVTQDPGDVPRGGRNWWKVGHFSALATSERMKWTTCTSTCYVNAATADLTSTRTSSAQKTGNGTRPHPALLVHTTHKPSDSSHSRAFSSRRSTTSNLATLDPASCKDYTCRAPQIGHSSGTTVTCWVRAEIDILGWSDYKTCSTVVLGLPSAPPGAELQHRETADPMTSEWCFKWSGPTDNGDLRSPVDLDRAMIRGYDWNLRCGDEHAEIMVGNIFSFCLQAQWVLNDATGRCDSQEVQQKFHLVSSSLPAFSFSCYRGNDVTFRVRARNDIFPGVWSGWSSQKALGLPSRVSDVAIKEVPSGLNLSWAQVTFSFVNLV